MPPRREKRTPQRRSSAAKNSRRRPSDLGAYNTLESAADLDDLRVALHIAKWNVYGISYGTDLALTYLRDHPGGIRSVAIDGVFPPSLAGGGAAWTSAGEGINAVFKACQQQAPCRKRYGDIGATFRRLVNQYEASPKTVAVAGPRPFRQSERQDQRRHAAAMDGLAGNASGGEGSRSDLCARPRRSGADRIHLGGAETRRRQYRRSEQRPFLRRLVRRMGAYETAAERRCSRATRVSRRFRPPS